MDVKYRGPVDLKTFACSDVLSSFVRRVCFDKANSYMLIDLNWGAARIVETPG